LILPFIRFYRRDTGEQQLIVCATRAGRCLTRLGLKTIEGAGTLRFLRPLFNCAAKVLKLRGSIWSDCILPLKAWQEDLLGFPV
jgi:hypothetical protein